MASECEGRDRNPALLPAHIDISAPRLPNRWACLRLWVSREKALAWLSVPPPAEPRLTHCRRLNRPLSPRVRLACPVRPHPVALSLWSPSPADYLSRPWARSTRRVAAPGPPQQARSTAHCRQAECWAKYSRSADCRPDSALAAPPALCWATLEWTCPLAAGQKFALPEPASARRRSATEADSSSASSRTRPPAAALARSEETCPLLHRLGVLPHLRAGSRDFVHSKNADRYSGWSACAREVRR